MNYFDHPGIHPVLGYGVWLLLIWILSSCTHQSDGPSAAFLATHHTSTGVAQYISNDFKFTKIDPIPMAWLPLRYRDQVFKLCEPSIDCIERVSRCVGKEFADDINRRCEGQDGYCGFHGDEFGYDDYVITCVKKCRKKK